MGSGGVRRSGPGRAGPDKAPKGGPGAQREGPGQPLVGKLSQARAFGPRPDACEPSEGQGAEALAGARARGG